MSVSRTKSSTIRIFGIPMDLGQNRRGVDMGPSAIRYAGLHERLRALGLNVVDSGNIDVPVMEAIGAEAARDERAHHVEAIAGVCRRVHEQAARCVRAGDCAIFLGGDHSISIGTISAVLGCHENPGVIWVDAHGDFNTPQTTPSGNVHGMVVSALMGRGAAPLTLGERLLRPEQIVMIAIRELDPQERLALRASGITIFTMRDIDENGMAAVVRRALHQLAAADALHISFDMDALDPAVAPGVGTPVRGGLRYREAHLLMEMLADDGRARTLDLVEVNPILDANNETARVAVEMAASLFGQRIL